MFLAFSDEINPRVPNNLENSLIDIDELSEEQRLQMCQRAIHLTSEMNVKLFDDTKTGASKYYFLQRYRERTSEVGSSTSTVMVEGIVQAFQCPTIPEVFVHVNYHEYAGQTLWFIMKESDHQPAFEFIGYHLKLFVEVIKGE